MSVLLANKEKTSHKNWLRMLKAFQIVYDNCDKPDAVLTKKGWRIQSIDAKRITDCLKENNVAFEQNSDYLIEIL